MGMARSEGKVILSPVPMVSQLLQHRIRRASPSACSHRGEVLGQLWAGGGHPGGHLNRGAPAPGARVDVAVLSAS